LTNSYWPNKFCSIARIHTVWILAIALKDPKGQGLMAATRMKLPGKVSEPDAREMDMMRSSKGRARRIKS
jgi:hypothetical protein